jgi:hypothetical protein
MKIIGIVMILVGSSLIITGIFFGIASFNWMGDSESNNFILFGGAASGCIFGGGVCIMIALLFLTRARVEKIL